MSNTHALFDPSSKYNALRACAVVPSKIEGLFLWHKTLREQGMFHQGATLPPLVLRAGSPTEVLEARVTLPTEPVLGDRFTIRVELLGERTSGKCRAFLVDRAVLERARKLATPGVLCREDINTLTLRDLATGDIRAVAPAEVRYPLHAVAVDESRVVVLTGFGELFLWDCLVGSAQLLKAATRTAPDPQLVALSGGRVAWTAESGKEVFVLHLATLEKQMLGPFDSQVKALIGLADGQVAVGLANGIVRVGERSWHDRGGAGVHALAALPDGRILVATTRGKLSLWSATEDRSEAIPDVVAASVAALPDGRVGIAGPKSVGVWEPGGQAVRVLSGERFLRLLAAPGERLLAVGEDDSLWVWRVNSGEKRLLKQHVKGHALVEPLVCARMRPMLPAEDVAALRLLFDHLLLAEVSEAQQLASAMAEVEGELSEGKGVLEGRIPVGCPNLPERMRVVVVLAGGGGA